MLKRLTIGQIEAREMDSIAVLDAPIEQFTKVSNWEFAPGGDDLDDFDAAVFEVQGLGSFSVLKYRGQPEGTSSVLTPTGLADATKQRLLDLVLMSGDLKPNDVQWTNLPAVKARRLGGGLVRGFKALKVAARADRKTAG